jgi:MFS family permease
MEMNYDERASL